MTNSTHIDWIKSLKKGDTAYYVNNNNRNHVVEITKVGRALLHTTGPTFYIDTGVEKTEYTSGRLYPSKEVFDAERAITSRWQDLRLKIDKLHSRPKHMDHEHMDALEALVFPVSE